MRTVFAAFLLLHGLAHLVGFLTPWGATSRRPGSPPPGADAILGGRVTLGKWAWRGLSFLWLALAAAVTIAAYGIWTDALWQWGALLGALTVSLVLTFIWMPAARFGLAINVVLIAAFLVAGALTYRHDIAIARDAVHEPTSTMRSSAGTIEYATLGQGEPVLVLHGTAGGWDQGINVTRELAHGGFRLIAPSRFGYLRTPMAEHASPALEADAWVELLDSLGLERVSVISLSAGATPALQLALRHPHRISRMVFLVPAGGGVFEQTAKGPPEWVLRVVMTSDFPTWVLGKLAPGAMLRLVAVPASLVPTLTETERAELQRGIDGLLPVSERLSGMAYDARNQSGAEGAYPLSTIGVPTLWISAADDLYRTLDVARHATSVVPGARLIEYPTGGHLLIGRGPELWPAVVAFLRSTSP